jgi:ubiquinone/menaquinone biosynthesis C-methylase UbiE
MGGGQIGSWQSAEYVGQWAGEDVLARMLETPRQISIALIRDAGIEVSHVVDLGSGEGPYLVDLLRAFEGARGTWLDSSEPMLERARKSLAEFGDRVTFIVAPAEELAGARVEPADVIVSSRALHHLTRDALARCYREVHDLLTPAGFFFNLDHVGSDSDWEQRYRRIRDQFTGSRQNKLNPHRQDEALHPVAEHLRCLEEAGFASVDVPWRFLYTALIAGRTSA